MNNDQFLVIDPNIHPIMDVYKILVHCVSPRPIALTSTISTDGISNLAPFSFFMAGGANPPSIVISPVGSRSGVDKHTLRNIKDTGEFVISVCTFDMRDRINQSSFEYPDGVSEWQKVGLTAVTSEIVKPAIVNESPISMECKLYQIISHGIGYLSANYIIGTVVRFHIKQDLIKDGKILAPYVDYIARMGENWYSHITSENMFEMPRPNKE